MEYEVNTKVNKLIPQIEKEKKSKGERKCLYLSFESLQVLEQSAGIMKSSESAAADSIIRQWFDRSEPIKEFQSIKKQQEELKEKLSELESKEKKILQKIEYYREFKELREKSKEEALSILTRKLTDGSSADEIKQIALFWSNRLDVPFEQLLFESNVKRKKENSESEKF